ncbi:competence type IV pilus minor pilin ComGD [Pradoshia sp.]
MRCNERGFTLLEALFVLGCLSVMLAVGNIAAFKLLEAYEQHAYMRQMEKDLYYAQMFAMENRTNVSVRIQTDDNKYTGVANGYGTLFTSYQPRTMKFRSAGLLVITYTVLGNIQNPMTINFINEKNRTIYKLIFQLGRGRFYFTSA